MFNKIVEFEHYDEYKYGGIVRCHSISFSRFSKIRIRKISKQIDRSTQLYIVVNRVGQIKKYGYKRVS